MKIRSALLRGGAFLVAAMPVWADRIAYPGTGEESRNIASSWIEFNIHAPELNAAVDSGFLARPASRLVLTGNFLASRVFDHTGAKPIVVSDTFFATQSDTDIHGVGLGLFGSFDSASSFAHNEMESRRARHGHDGGISGGDNPLLVSVPEPGSLALSLVGLVGIGLLALRRGIA